MMTRGTTRSIERPAALRQRVREMIARELDGHLEAVYLFGSRARGDATTDSDWDVLAIVGEDVDIVAARAAMRRITGSIVAETNERVSIVVLRWSDADAHAALLRNVAREGQRL